MSWNCIWYGLKCKNYNTPPQFFWAHSRITSPTTFPGQSTCTFTTHHQKCTLPSPISPGHFTGKQSLAITKSVSPYYAKNTVHILDTKLLLNLVTLKYTRSLCKMAEDTWGRKRNKKRMKNKPGSGLSKMIKN